MTYQHQIFFNMYGVHETVVRAAHSIYYEVLGNHGWIGLFLFLGLWFSTYWNAGWLRRAGGRLEAIRARESAAAARPALEAPAPAASTAAPAQPPARRAARIGAPPASAAQQQAQDRAAQQGRRLQQAREHEEAVKARNARRDAHRPPAAGLPVPAASASAP